MELYLFEYTPSDGTPDELTAADYFAMLTSNPLRFIYQTGAGTCPDNPGGSWGLLSGSELDPRSSRGRGIATYIPPPTPVPEPTSMLLLGSGLVVGLGARLRRRR